jgi:hypothetical protein
VVWQKVASARPCGVLRRRIAPYSPVDAVNERQQLPAREHAQDHFTVPVAMFVFRVERARVRSDT